MPSKYIIISSRSQRCGNGLINLLFATSGIFSAFSLHGSYWETCDETTKFLFDKEFETTSSYRAIRVFVIITMIFSWMGFGISTLSHFTNSATGYRMCANDSFWMFLSSCFAFSLFLNDHDYSCTKGPGFAFMVVVFVESFLLFIICMFTALEGSYSEGVSIYSNL